MKLNQGSNKTAVKELVGTGRSGETVEGPDKTKGQMKLLTKNL